MVTMKTLSIDIETYSATNLAKAGVYRYSEDSDFEILLFGYSYFFVNACHADTGIRLR